ncbi:pentapeptide repeat-containing protein [Streptomyces sp. NPDC056501]|uniref:pentapeptide repeat-containing protein n=1 Tax=Streptomyces sp. NPDC056501 TaxID=3345841 RepID=UPI003693333E
MWSILAALVGLGAVGVALWQVPWWLDARYLPTITQPQATAVTGVRTALLAMGAGGLATVGIIYTHRTLHQNREGQVTDRYTKAIGQIASDKPVEQLGGIYALERIMRDSVKDHATIVEVLAAFVREHAPAPEISMQKPLQRWRDAGAQYAVLLRRNAEHNADPRPAEPVQAALTVLGRRPQDRDEPFLLNLGYTNLRRANLNGAHLEGANLNGAHLEGANLYGAHLEGAVLSSARLKEADLREVNLERAMLWGAHLEKANLYRADLEMADLFAADLEGANLWGAHLEMADLSKVVGQLTVEQLVSARPRRSTFLPERLAADPRVMARIDAVEKEGL